LQGINLFDIIPWDYIMLKNGLMAKKDKNVVELEGIVKKTLPDGKFLVEIEANGQKLEILAYLSGRMRMNYIWIVEGDRVTVEITPYDPKKGRITYRYKQ
jgi:translation initiation factor IF-1